MDDYQQAKVLCRKAYMLYGSEMIHWRKLSNIFSEDKSGVPAAYFALEKMAYENGGLDVYDTNKSKMNNYDSDEVNFIKVNESVMEE